MPAKEASWSCVYKYMFSHWLFSIIFLAYLYCTYRIHIETYILFCEGAKVVTRAVFQQSTDRFRSRNFFEVVALSEAKGSTVNVELKPPADAPVGE